MNSSLEIEDGVHLIKNPHRNYYVSSVLILGDSLTLIDAGRAESPNTSIYPAIKALGRDPMEIDLIVLTHAHWDHCAGVAQIKRETDCRVAVHINGECYLRNPEMVVREINSRFPGVPPGKMGAFDAIEPDELFIDGTEIHLDGRKLKVVHTPGHSPCSCCIVEPDFGLYIAGDSIQGWGGRRPLIFYDLKDYLSSMEQLLDEPIKTMVNGHPFSPSGKGILKGEEAIRQIEGSIRAVDELTSTILRILDASEAPTSLMKILEIAKISRAFTIGCILEVLEAEGKVTRETVRGNVLWQK
jgi:glyoxylase-like metal-dependent hydrolase (beta-lactamase superfamily II)